jgi:hypothetical protein
VVLVDLVAHQVAAAHPVEAELVDILASKVHVDTQENQELWDFLVQVA